MTELVCNPCGVIEPQHLGQFFFDKAAEVFYQARGRTAADWQFVAPKDFIGSFVKIYDLFLGVPANDPRGPDAATYVHDTELVKETMALDGVEILSANRWMTAAGVDVLQCRLRLHRVDGLSLFIGFAPEARAHAMPSGLGFTIDDGILSFNQGSRPVEPGAVELMRIEISAKVEAFVNGEPFSIAFGAVAATSPILALFVKGPGERKIAPGYERALKRNLAR
jgi:hypothetical protein